MAVANGASFFSRFTMKFVEVIGAGIATAVTGYLIAHLGLGGLWSTPARTPEVAPAAVQMTPAVSSVPKSARASPAQPPAAVEAIAPAAAKPDATKPDAVAEKDPAAAGTQPARAATPVRLALLDVGQILQVCERNPLFGAAFYREMARVLSSRLDDTRRRLSHHLPRRSIAGYPAEGSD